MKSPFPPSTAAPGEGRIVASLAPNGEPGLEAVAYQYPLKLIAPTTGAGLGTTDGIARKKSALVFVLSYGGGLVAGDQVRLDIHVRRRARLSLVTQGTTKVFKAGARGPSTSVVPTRQTMTMHVAPGGGLCLLPDPVQPFADSLYEQVQRVTLDERAITQSSDAPSLCLLDWVTQGRAARGENWAFAGWKGRNEVWLQTGPPERTRLLVRDAVMLAPEYLGGSGGGAQTSLQTSLQGLAVFGTLILRGPLVDATGRFFMDEFAALPRLGARGFHHSDGSNKDADDNNSSTTEWRRARVQQEQAHGVLWSAAAVRGCVVVKFGARSVEGGRLWLGAMLQHEGSVGAAFGDEALMCVR